MFGNEPSDIASIFGHLLSTTFKGVFNRIIFAIFDEGQNLDAFRKQFVAEANSAVVKTTHPLAEKETKQEAKVGKVEKTTIGTVKTAAISAKKSVSVSLAKGQSFDVDFPDSFEVEWPSLPSRKKKV